LGLDDNEDNDIAMRAIVDGLRNLASLVILDDSKKVNFSGF
jgi:hypothetical protein